MCACMCAHVNSKRASNKRTVENIGRLQINQGQLRAVIYFVQLARLVNRVSRPNYKLEIRFSNKKRIEWERCDVVGRKATSTTVHVTRYIRSLSKI